jgi:acetylornithine deacetylase
MIPDVVALTQQLVQIPSLNPMGGEVRGSDYLEARLTDFLQHWAGERQIPWERHTVLPGRDNLLMRLQGRGPHSERTVLLEVHQDTVPVDGMTIAPFAAELREERIFGRGACDVKGGMAAMLTTIAQLAEQSADHPTIVLACTVNEENGFHGVRHLCQLWCDGTSALLPRRPDVAVVAEPTELDVVVAHKGTVRWRCHTLGRAAHSSNPAAGENAIYRMQPVLQVLQQYANHVLAASAEDPLVGRATLSVGTIHGGLSVNTVPDRCTIEIDRRLLSSECPTAAYDQVRAYLASQLGESAATHEPPFLSAPGLTSGVNGPLAQKLSRCSQRQGGHGQCIGVPFGTDAGTLSAAGIPTVVFGPGSIRQAHTKDEWIDVSSLRQAVEILVEFCQDPHDAASF